ncbi:hypothetical protein C8R46DRAFT_1024662 [Mycena filopes]|nr:hypothetical protein C8R46DRAFT_1024662 [Mycena filopes]
MPWDTGPKRACGAGRPTPKRARPSRPRPRTYSVLNKEADAPSTSTSCTTQSHRRASTLADDERVHRRAHPHIHDAPTSSSTAAATVICNRPVMRPRASLGAHSATKAGATAEMAPVKGGKNKYDKASEGSCTQVAASYAATQKPVGRNPPQRRSERVEHWGGPRQGATSVPRREESPFGKPKGRYGGMGIEVEAHHSKIESRSKRKTHCPTVWNPANLAVTGQRDDPGTAAKGHKRR